MKVSVLGLALVDRITDMAREKGILPSQLALAWVLSRGGDMAPIPGTKRRRYLEENVAAADVALNREELDRIEALAPKGAAADGARASAPAFRLPWESRMESREYC